MDNEKAQQKNQKVWNTIYANLIGGLLLLILPIRLENFLLRRLRVSFAPRPFWLVGGANLDDLPMLSVDSFLSILPFAEEGNTGVIIIQWSFIVLLVALSGMFSGLNLGLMSLDKLGLEVRTPSPLSRFLGLMGMPSLSRADCHPKWNASAEFARAKNLPHSKTRQLAPLYDPVWQRRCQCTPLHSPG